MFNNSDLKYEYKNTKKLITPTFWVTTITHLIVLIFFFGVGYLDHESDNTIFEHFNSLIGLATTISVLIIAIYGSVKSCRYIISNYIGDNKIRLYTYPNGRGKLLINKMAAFILPFSITEIISLLIINIIFLIITRLFNLLPADINILSFIIVMIAIMLFSISILLITTSIGVRFSSKVSAIVATVILVAALCDVISILCASSAFLSFGISIVALIVSLLVLNYCKTYINHDELITK